MIQYVLLWKLAYYVEESKTESLAINGGLSLIQNKCERKEYEKNGRKYRINAYLGRKKGY